MNQYYDPQRGGYVDESGHVTQAVNPGVYGGYPGTAPAPVFNSDRYKDNPFDINSSDANERRRAQQYRESVDKSAMDQAGKPSLPEFVSAANKDGTLRDAYKYNPTTMAMPGSINLTSMMPGLNKNINGVQNDMSGINAMKDYALSQGDSPWLKMAKTEQGLEENNQLQKASQGAAGANANAQSSLAMRGGLSSGARERLARSGAMNENQVLQGVRNAGAQTRAGLGVQDESNKLGMLPGLASAQLANTGQELGKQEYLGNMASTEQGRDLDTQGKNVANTMATNQFNTTATNQGNQFNIQNSLNDLLQNRAYNVNSYNEQMRAWAAGKTADAQGGGKK